MLSLLCRVDSDSALFGLKPTVVCSSYSSVFREFLGRGTKSNCWLGSRCDVTWYLAALSSIVWLWPSSSAANEVQGHHLRARTHARSHTCCLLFAKQNKTWQQDSRVTHWHVQPRTFEQTRLLIMQFSAALSHPACRLSLSIKDSPGFVDSAGGALLEEQILDG